jgi:hypothetical protein
MATNTLARPVANPTETPIPPTATRTQTLVAPTATPTTTPVATTAMPTATSTGGGVPQAGQLCPAWVHDASTTRGPDEKPYPTWHPPVDPTSGCTFGHEHGDDPRTSRANASLPPFGYLGSLIGDSEPHAGFKVFVANRGLKNDEGRTMQVDSRLVFHMGTGGTARFATRFHSAIFDVVAPTGHTVHLQGMADTGRVGSICQDRSVITRVVQTLPGSGCDTASTYEIWSSTLRVISGSANGNPVEAIITPAVFDPILLMDPSNPTRKLFTGTFFSGDFLGCKREAYHGPVYWRNASGSTTYQTDAYGVVTPGGPLRQEVSRHDAIGIPFTQDQGQFKQPANSCAPGLSLAN